MDLDTFIAMVDARLESQKYNIYYDDIQFERSIGAKEVLNSLLYDLLYMKKLKDERKTI